MLQSDENITISLQSNWNKVDWSQTNEHAVETQNRHPSFNANSQEMKNTYEWILF